MSSDGDADLSFYAKEPSPTQKGARVTAARVFLSQEEEISVYHVHALRRGWFRGRRYIRLLQGAALASAFQSVGIPCHEAVSKEQVRSFIRAAQAMP